MPFTLKVEKTAVLTRATIFYFFGQEAIKWKFSPFTNSFIHEQNYYSDTTFYFFTPDLSTAGKRIQQQTQAIGTAVEVVNTFLDYQLHEEETENLILSGKSGMVKCYQRPTR